MKQRIILSLVVLCGIMLGSCRRGIPVFKVTGTLTNIPVSEVYLTSISYQKDIILIMDSAAVKGGKFELKCPAPEQKLFRVMFGDPNKAPWVGVINDNSSVQIYMDGSQNGSYTVKGSPASQRFHEVLDSMYGIFQTSGKNVADVQRYLASMVRGDPSPAIAGFALTQFMVSSSADSLASLASLSDDLQKRFPANTEVSGIVGAVRHTLDIPRAGAMAPDLALPDTSGKIFTISSLRGKYVLVDFWASWCGPCRQENPNVVKAYQEFKDKNFTIVGVSLDQKKEDWLNAIHTDHLFWIQISDLMSWQSKAVETFQFDGIPYNVLLDPQGRIIGTSLRGEALEAKLRSVLQ